VRAEGGGASRSRRGRGAEAVSEKKKRRPGSLCFFASSLCTRAKKVGEAKQGDG
jgi:hypothetical protein